MSRGRISHGSAFVGALLGSLLLGFAGAAQAKDFRPGNLRVCNAKRCIPVANSDVLEAISSFYYGESPPAVAPRPRLGVPTFELRFRNGYVTGIVATVRLDRFLSYGVHSGYFRQGAWYRLPSVASSELKKLTAALTPLRLTRAAVQRSR